MLPGDLVDHWETVYGTRSADRTSWYQSVPKPSLALIHRAGPALDAPIVDAGGGSSTLVDHLLDAGHTDITVVDVSTRALQRARDRLGVQAVHVRWVDADVVSVQLDRTVSLWHDRAVFHFLVTEAKREEYRQTVLAHLAPHGHLVVATFALDGPETCSGLPVERYDVDRLAAFWGPDLELVASDREVHRTPWDSEQSFTWALLRRV